jgi:catechol 2,3-dioxygenase-like lactoylglutathione lyase family enzyme
MLSNAPVHPTLPVIDLERAKKFYEGALGLKVILEDPSPGAVLKAGEGTTPYIYQRAATKADHTVAGFKVKDVEATVRELKVRGVVFEDVDAPSLRTVDGVATVGEIKAVWFKDTEGNTLSVNNM